MGYTHYFAYDPLHPSFAEGWAQLVRDTRRIVDLVQHRGVILADANGREEPRVNSRSIEFNGKGPDSHESFVIGPGEPVWGPGDKSERQFVWGFCKTARKPYDVAVTSVLLRAVMLMPQAFAIQSDGSWEFEWAYGAEDEDYQPSHRLVPARTRWPDGHGGVCSARGVISAIFGENRAIGGLGARPPFSETMVGPPCISEKS